MDYIHEAPNGKMAYEMVQQAHIKGQSYGLIFMDCSMPIMNGFESTQKIRNYLSDYED